MNNYTASFTLDQSRCVMDLNLSRNGVSKSLKVRLQRSDVLRRLCEKIFGDSLLPTVPEISDELFGKATEDIERHFELNPCRLNYTLVELGEAFSDRHLFLLRWIPEIEIVKIYSDRVTDCGVRHLRSLTNLKELVVYSPRVTNRALEMIRHHSKLEVLDMQCCPKVTPQVFTHFVSSMHLRRSWPPHEKHGT